MKKILSLFIIVFVLFSCEELEDIGENPNNVSETHPQLLLTKIGWDAFQVEGVSPLFAARMVVQTDGEMPEQYYKWDRASFNDFERLRNVQKMMEEAKRIENLSYQALAKFFRAYYFYNLTLTFGDIPYSEALKGEEDYIYSPGYDTQQEVFAGILQELRDASNMLTDDLIEGDIIYGGNPDKWRKLINSFRLKVLITLSEKASEAGLNIASEFASIVANEPILESVNDNGQLVFLDQLGSRYTEYNNSSYGSARYMDSTLIQKLKDRQDPRLFIYSGQTRVAKEAGLAIDDFSAYDGGNPIAPYNDVNLKAAAGLVSKPNLRYTTDPTTEPHTILGYPELQFILAEASVRGWINADAKTHYENGVKASFEFYNMHAEDYASFVTEQAAEQYLTNDLVDFDNASTNEEQIELIITQKYLQSFLQGGWSVYFEHLRTGYPDFATLPGVTPPTRWIYPNEEYQLNSENVAAAIARQFGEGNDNIRAIPWWIE
ncbi:MAG: SusD/RagB family nutrient-binding outer membrane lipoprotein [Bacteroidota bacterium]